MALADFFVDLMHVQAPRPVTKDTSAGPLQDFRTVTSNVPCQINELSAGQRVRAAMANMDVTHEILTHYAGVKQGYRVVDAELGVVIRVTGIQRVREQGGIETYFVISGEEVKDGAP